VQYVDVVRNAWVPCAGDYSEQRTQQGGRLVGAWHTRLWDACRVSACWCVLTSTSTWSDVSVYSYTRIHTVGRITHSIIAYACATRCLSEHHVFNNYKDFEIISCTNVSKHCNVIRECVKMIPVSNVMVINWLSLLLLFLFMKILLVQYNYTMPLYCT